MAFTTYGLKQNINTRHECITHLYACLHVVRSHIDSFFALQPELNARRISCLYVHIKQ
jgi:hypothetical protein